MHGVQQATALEVGEEIEVAELDMPGVLVDHMVQMHQEDRTRVADRAREVAEHRGSYQGRPVEGM